MIKKIEEIPEDVEEDSVLEIISNKVNYFTHGFFKYPCKFIPQIPRWAINKYTKEQDIVLDPFAGSGTTMVEAVINARNCLAIDFDKFSQLLCKVKTTELTYTQVELIKKLRNRVLSNKKLLSASLPDIHNLSHWFPQKNIEDLLLIKSNIEDISLEIKDDSISDFLLVCFASIIRKCSFADEVSPKPYVSSRINKTPLDVKTSFNKVLENYLNEFEKRKFNINGKCIIFGDDARNINQPTYENKIELAVTSPPYINAFDYVRSLRLENAWLGYYGDTNIVDIKKKQIGTESIPAIDYTRDIPLSYILELNNVITKISRVDKKRGFIVWKFFQDMNSNFIEIFKLLKPGGHYVVVIGDSVIRDVPVRTHEILKDIAIVNGYLIENKFSYIIKNRYLRIPRSGQGGIIDKDWILDLRKPDGKEN